MVNTTTTTKMTAMREDCQERGIVENVEVFAFLRTAPVGIERRAAATSTSAPTRAAKTDSSDTDCHTEVNVFPSSASSVSSSVSSNTGTSCPKNRKRPRMDRLDSFETGGLSLHDQEGISNEGDDLQAGHDSRVTASTASASATTNESVLDADDSNDADNADDDGDGWVSDWPLAVHEQFVLSIFNVGLQKATPNQVLDHMVYREQQCNDREHNMAIAPATSSDVKARDRSFKEKLKSHLQKFKKHSERERSKFLQEYTDGLMGRNTEERTVEEDKDKGREERLDAGKTERTKQKQPCVLRKVLGGRSVAQTTLALSNLPNRIQVQAQAQPGQHAVEEVGGAESDDAAALMTTKHDRSKVDYNQATSSRGGSYVTLPAFPMLTESERQTTLGQSLLLTQNLLEQLNNVLRTTRMEEVKCQQREQEEQSIRQERRWSASSDRDMAQGHEKKTKKRRASKTQAQDVVYASPETMKKMMANVQLVGDDDDGDDMQVGQCAYKVASNIDRMMKMVPSLPLPPPMMTKDKVSTPVQRNMVISNGRYLDDFTNRYCQTAVNDVRFNTVDTTQPVASPIGPETSEVTPMSMQFFIPSMFQYEVASDDLEPLRIFKDGEVSTAAVGGRLERYRTSATHVIDGGSNLAPLLSSLVTVPGSSDSQASADTHESSNSSSYPPVLPYENDIQPRQIEIIGKQRKGKWMGAAHQDQSKTVPSSCTKSAPILPSLSSPVSPSHPVQQKTYQVSSIDLQQDLPELSDVSVKQTAETRVDRLSSRRSYDHYLNPVVTTATKKNTVDGSPRTQMSLQAPPTFCYCNPSADGAFLSTSFSAAVAAAATNWTSCNCVDRRQNRQYQSYQ